MLDVMCLCWLYIPGEVWCGVLCCVYVSVCMRAVYFKSSVRDLEQAVVDVGGIVVEPIPVATAILLRAVGCNSTLSSQEAYKSKRDLCFSMTLLTVAA